MSAISVVAIVPLRIFAEVTASAAIVGSAAVPLKSPANCTVPFASVVASLAEKAEPVKVKPEPAVYAVPAATVVHVGVPVPCEVNT